MAFIGLRRNAGRSKFNCRLRFCHAWKRVSGRATEPERRASVTTQWKWKRLLACLASMASLLTGQSQAGTAYVAVASNFARVAEQLARRFEAEHPHEIVLLQGSTGRLYAQILNGAPFDVFLAADSERPARLEERSAIVPGTRFTYAVGRLAVWIRQPAGDLEPTAASLLDSTVRTIALPNPDLAPFGQAAVEVMNSLDAADQIAGKLVFAENVGQAFAFVATGNADAGFVSLSYLRDTEAGQSEWKWVVPQDMHQPIDQDAVLLRRAAGNSAAIEFLLFMRTDDARKIISGFGYEWADADD